MRKRKPEESNLSRNNRTQKGPKNPRLSDNVGESFQSAGSRRVSEKVTITLAIDKRVMDNIRRTVSRDGTSINATINDVLTKWDRFYQYLPEHQVIIVTARNFEKFLELLDEQTFIDMWKYDENLVNGLFGQRGIPLTLDNLIEYEYKIFGIMGGAFKSVLAHRDSEGYTNLVFTHRYGIKWSRIISAVFTDQLSTYFKCNTTSEIIPSRTTIKILDKDVTVSENY